MTTNPLGNTSAGPLPTPTDYSGYNSRSPHRVVNSTSSVIQTNSGITPNIYSGGLTKDNSLGFTGTAATGSIVSIYDGSIYLGNATLNNGAWSYTTVSLKDGRHNFQIKITSAGKTSNSLLYATIDTLAPTGSFSSTITTNTGGTKTISSGGKTTDHTLGLSGSAENGSIVKIYDNGAFVGNAKLNGKNWTFNTDTLINGTHAFTATITDQAGNSLQVVGAIAEVYSSVPVGTVSSSILTNTGATNSIQSGGLTKDNTLGLFGTVKAGSVVEIFDGTLSLGTASVIGTNWSFTTLALKDGLHNFQIKANNGTDSILMNASAKVDTVAVGTFSTTLLTDSGTTQTINSGAKTSDHTLGLRGTAESGSVIEIYDNGALIGNANLIGSEWSFTTEQLNDGAHNLTAKVIDSATNESSLNGVKAEIYTPEPTPPVLPTHTWSDVSGWGSIDALAAINFVTQQSLKDIVSDATMPWGISKANMNDAWNYGYTGKGVTIAVIDTGMSLTNTDLTQNLSKWNWDFVNNDADVTDDHGHGTFVASEIIAANNGIGLTGAAYDAELMVLKAMDQFGSGSADTIVQAIKYAVDHGANIINMSLGGSDYSGYADAFTYAQSHNVLMVMAAGNNAGTDPLNPAAYAKTYSNAVAVGALQLNADSSQTMASFSNLAGSGPYGYINAAGQNVWGYGLDGSIYTWNGTSMATPYAAAEAALILSANHNLTAEQIVLAMTQTSHNVM